MQHEVFVVKQDARQVLKRWQTAVFLAIKALGAADMSEITDYIDAAGGRKSRTGNQQVFEAMKELDEMGIIREVPAGRVLAVYELAESNNADDVE